jgi:hypothetical protein
MFKIILWPIIVVGSFFGYQPYQEKIVSISSIAHYAQHVEGSLLASAYGDALGRVTEFIGSVDEIFSQYPQGICSVDDFKAKD